MLPFLKVRILDPRVEKSCIQTANSHPGIKDSRVVWLGEQNKVLSTGFDAQRLRQIIIRDLRNFTEPEKTLELDCSTGILIPLYDADTGMLFLAGKGNCSDLLLLQMFFNVYSVFGFFWQRTNVLSSNLLLDF